jgi:uridine kinase
VLRASVDGFHHSQEHRYQKGEYSAAGYYEDTFDYRAVSDYLLRRTPSILLFDGVFLFRRELASHWDFRILVDVDPATSLARAIARDTGVLGSAGIVRRKYEARYEPAWRLYVQQETPDSKADIILDNRDFSQPRIVKPR